MTAYNCFIHLNCKQKNVFKSSLSILPEQKKLDSVKDNLVNL